MLDLSKGCPSFTSGIFRQGDYPIVPKISFDDNTLDQESRIDYYETLLCRALVERSYTRGNEQLTQIMPRVGHILKWLRCKDFYTAPASTKYHDAYNSGLLTHSLRVYNELVGLRNVPKFRMVAEPNSNQWWSAVFVALVHDWCKIGRYEPYMKNTKNEKTGEWEQLPAYRYKEDAVGRLGHGTQSLIMIMQLCNSPITSLSFEEMAAIRWHMNNWDATSYDYTDLRVCNAQIPMVHMIQFADQLAITEY